MSQRRCPFSTPAPFGCAGRKVPLLALLLASCASNALLRPLPAATPDATACRDRATAPANAPVDSDGQKVGGGDTKKDEPAAKEKEPPPPHTLCQAIWAYWVKLHSHPCSATTEGEKDGDKLARQEAEGKKSPPARGESDDQDARKERSDSGKGNGDTPRAEAEGKKSPPATKEEDKKNGENGEDKEGAKDTWYSAHAQATMDTQRHAGFFAAYTGARSLSPLPEWNTSATSTLFLAARLWDCNHYLGEVVFNPELAGGSGFSGVNGLAGFTNGDITRVGRVEPTPYIARLFLRQTWGFGGDQEKVEDEPNQIAGKRDVNRFTFIVGKFAFTDVVDVNRYSHDPRSQMTNWSLMYNGAWDYPANVRGYSYGFAADYNQKYWALRYSAMAEPTIANGAAIDPHFLKAFGQALEWEGRWGLEKGEHPGRVRLMAYLNRAHMGDYREALEQVPDSPDVTTTRDYRFKYGFGLNVEQELTRDLGVWARLGWNDGHTETWAFTPLDRTVAMGFLLKGTCWARPNDEVGLAGALNGLAKSHRGYLAAGGLDFSIGDGALSYGLEHILEVYYRVAVGEGIYLTPDFQEIWNPAYNRDRGPVSVASLLVHIEF